MATTRGWTAAPRTGRPKNLTSTRLLPPRARATWRCDLLFAQLDELNAAFDRLVRPGSQGEAAEQIDQVRARARRIVRAVTLVAETAIEASWRYVASELDRPDDAFGAAVVLLALAPESAATRTWAAGLPTNVKRALKLIREPAIDV